MSTFSLLSPQKTPLFSDPPLIFTQKTYTRNAPISFYFNNRPSNHCFKNNYLIGNNNNCLLFSSSSPSPSYVSFGKFSSKRVFLVSYSSSSGDDSFDGGAPQIGSTSEDEDDDEVVVDNNYHDGIHLPERWDVLGIGQAMVTHSISFFFVLLQFLLCSFLFLYNK